MFALCIVPISANRRLAESDMDTTSSLSSMSANGYLDGSVALLIWAIALVDPSCKFASLSSEVWERLSSLEAPKF